MNKFLLSLVLSLGIVSFLAAGGTPEPYKEVKGKENWHYDYDLNKMEPGKYNLVIKAQDKAGNLSVIGPININIDPASDIPVTTIQSPFKGMRSTGKVNIVGTAVDDDGVDFVEIQLGEEGPLLRASGKKYWSYYMDISNLPDGDYQIRARSTDINGIQSPWAVVNFHLDQYKPLVQVTSHKVGEILKGSVKLTGEVTEANGIGDMLYATSFAGPYQKIGFNYDEQNKKYNFSLDLDTGRLKDGPQVFWFKAINKLGNEGSLAYLFFVDNTPPKVEILYPETTSGSAGKVFIVGQLIEDVGIESVTWSVVDSPVQKDQNKLNGELKLIPGNPFWTLPLDFSNEPGDSRTVRFVAVDRTGNSSTSQFKFLLDKEADRPVIALQTPVSKEKYSDKVELRGWIRDDDGVASLTWSLLDGTTETLETKGAFNLVLPMKSSGVQKLTLVAKDINGLESQPMVVDFTFVPPTPGIQFTEVSWKADKAQTETKAPYQPGVILPGEKVQSLIGKVFSLDRLSQIEYQINNGKPENIGVQETAKGEYQFVLSLSDEKLGRGSNLVSVKVKDSYGSEAFSQAVVINYLNDLWDNRFKDSSEGDRHRLTFEPTSDPKEKGNRRAFLIPDSHLSAAGKVLLKKDEKFEVIFNEEVKSGAISVELVPSTPLFQVSAQSVSGEFNILTVVPKGEGIAKAKIKVTSGKNSYETQVFDFNSLTSGPEIQVIDPVIGFWAGSDLEIKGKVLDVVDLDSLEYSLDAGQNWKNIAFIQPQKVPVVSGTTAIAMPTLPPKLTNDFSGKIDLKAVGDGNLNLLIRAKNKGGLISLFNQPFFRNTAPPVMNIFAPSPDKTVNGLVTIVGGMKSMAPIKILEFSDDNGKSFKPLIVDMVSSHEIDFSKYKVLPEKFFYRATDLSGNVTTLPEIFKVDTEIDKPKVTVQIPDEKEVLRNDFFISGLAVDDDGIQKIYYRLDGIGEFISVEGKNSFSIPVSLNDITDTDHYVELYSEDINGTKGNVVKRNFTVSRSGPVSKLLRPDLNTTQKGRVLLEGTSEDPNGVDSVYLSFDNGNTFLKMNGAEQWNYPLDTSLLSDGVYTLFIKALDKTGAVGDYTVLFSSDNTAPEISLTSPKDGEEISENISLEGRAGDNLNLKALKYTFKPLDEKGALVTGQLPTNGGFTQTIDLTKLSFGWYNLNLEGNDDAGNVTYIARNIQIKQKTKADRIEIFYPAQGEKTSGPIKVEGRYYSKTPQDKVILFIGGKPFSTLSVNEYGYFSTTISAESIKAYLTPESMAAGGSAPLVLRVESAQDSAAKLVSLDRNVVHQLQGPWVRIQSHKLGDFITKRPYLTGYLGYYFLPITPPEDPAAPPVPDPVYGPKKLTAKQIQESPITLELSIDNGLSFQPLNFNDANSTTENPLDKGTKEWKYRIETQNFPQGELTFLLKATFADGSEATSRQILVVDEIKPKLELLGPVEEGKFNQSLKVLGTASDENDLAGVSVLLRKGDKVFTKVPTFIQGMYMDAYYNGATLWSTGLGLTFFDQNVKLQGQVGRAIPGSSQRFDGYVVAGKLLANVASIPWQFFGGPDFEGFVSSFAVGANFSYFTMVETLSFDKGVILGAVVGQFEPFRITLESWPIFKSIGFYGESSLWFISSDVKPEIKLLWSLGMRLQLF